METFNIIGIDPGLNMGVSVYNISLPDYNVNYITPLLYKIDNYLEYGDSYYYNHMYARCNLIYNITNSLLTSYSPLAIAYEAAFMNSKYATAVIQLTQYTNSIERAIRDYDPFIKVITYPPMLIKKLVGAGGQADKEDMLNNAKQIPLLNSKLPLDSLSEHEVDAASIAYVLYNDILSKPWMLYTL